MPLPSALLPQTCDIFRAGAGSAAATNVPCQLVPAFDRGRQRFTGEANAYTHYLIVDAAVDIRDGSAGIGSNNPASADTVKIPGNNAASAVAYAVVYVEYHNRGAAGEYKHVYLDRKAPPWPTL
jgi:hypothetical protein